MTSNFITVYTPEGREVIINVSTISSIEIFEDRWEGQYDVRLLGNGAIFKVLMTEKNKEFMKFVDGLQGGIRGIE